MTKIVEASDTIQYWVTQKGESIVIQPMHYRVLFHLFWIIPIYTWVRLGRGYRVTFYDYPIDKEDGGWKQWESSEYKFRVIASDDFEHEILWMGDFPAADWITIHYHSYLAAKKEEEERIKKASDSLASLSAKT